MRTDVSLNHDTPPCSEDLPLEFSQLIGRCEINESTFTNDEMSVALKFGQMLFRRLTRMAEHYERMSENFARDDAYGMVIADAAKDMREVVRDCVKDL